MCVGFLLLVLKALFRFKNKIKRMAARLMHVMEVLAWQERLETHAVFYLQENKVGRRTTWPCYRFQLINKAAKDSKMFFHYTWKFQKQKFMEGFLQIVILVFIATISISPYLMLKYKYITSINITKNCVHIFKGPPAIW